MDKKDILTIDLVKMIRALWRRLWLIVLAAVVCGGAAFAYARFYLRPTYVADTRIYVNNSSFSLGSTSFSISSSDLNAAQSLVDTYIVILNSRSTIMDIIEESGVSYSYNTVKSMISASAVSGTEIFRVTVTAHDPDTACLIANTIAKVLPGRIAEIVDGSSVRIVDYAVKPNYKSGPDITKYTAVGLVAGAVVACGGIILLTALDTVVHDDDYLTEKYPNIPVLSIIPNLNENDDSRPYKYRYRYYGKYYAKSKYAYGKGNRQ